MADYIRFHLDRDDLEMKLGGGLPKGSLMIIEGEDGGGKSIISQRITYGALVNDHTVSYITTEMNILDFVRQMESLNYDISQFLLEENLILISLINLFGRIKSKENLIFELKRKKAKKLFSTDMLVIDSLSYPLVNNISQKEIEDLIDFLLRVKSFDKTVILTYNPEDINPNLAKELRRVSDVYFQVGISSLAGNLTRFVEVKRFRNPRSAYSLMTPFRVEPGLGVIVEIVTIV